MNEERGICKRCGRGICECLPQIDPAHWVPTGGVPRRVDKSSPEPAPVANGQPAVWPLVMVDMAQRDQFGRKKYGTPLQPHNGRDALTDAYQEALDLAVYLRTAIFERDGK